MGKVIKIKENIYDELFSLFVDITDCSDCPLKSLCTMFLERDVCSMLEDYIEGYVID